MGFLRSLFGKKEPASSNVRREPQANDDRSPESLGEANQDHGRQGSDLASNRHDIDYMKVCCDAELKTMELTGVVAAPYYFERIAILSRKAKRYRQEIEYCETYINLVEACYATHGTSNAADVRKGPRFQAIVARLPRARQLMSKSKQLQK